MVARNSQGWKTTWQPRKEKTPQQLSHSQSSHPGRDRHTDRDACMHDLRQTGCDVVRMHGHMEVHQRPCKTHPSGAALVAALCRCLPPAGTSCAALQRGSCCCTSWADSIEMGLPERAGTSGAYGQLRATDLQTLGGRSSWRIAAHLAHSCTHTAVPWMSRTQGRGSQ